MDWTSMIIGCIFWAVCGASAGIGFGLWTTRRLYKSIEAWSDAVNESYVANREWSNTLKKEADSLHKWSNVLRATERYEEYQEGEGGKQS